MDDCGDGSDEVSCGKSTVSKSLLLDWHIKVNQQHLLLLLYNDIAHSVNLEIFACLNFHELPNL